MMSPLRTPENISHNSASISITHPSTRHLNCTVPSNPSTHPPKLLRALHALKPPNPPLDVKLASRLRHFSLALPLLLVVIVHDAHGDNNKVPDGGVGQVDDAHVGPAPGAKGSSDGAAVVARLVVVAADCGFRVVDFDGLPLGNQITSFYSSSYIF